MKRIICIFISICFIIGALRFRAAADDTPAYTYSTALIEAQTGMCLGGTDPDLPLPVGSQTKLMTVLVTAETVAAGALSPDELVTVSPSAEGVSGATIWLRGGEKMSVNDLLKGVIIGNANDACTALACRISGSETAFVQEMNAAAFSLGLRSTRFADCTGLSAANISTAHELGLICRALLEYEWLTPIFTTWRDFLRGEGTELVSENRLTRNYEGLRGMKAGHGEASGYTLTAAASREQLTAIAVILGCNDADQRFDDAKKMLSQAFSKYYITTPDLSAEFMLPIPVRHGTASAVLPETGALLSIAAPKGESISNAVVLPKYLDAPVHAGDVIGSAAFYCGDTLLYESALTAAEDVPRRGFRETLLLLLDALFR